ncbi:poly-gamma-glutamate synthesis protein (capsule biosynthesis protein) [Cellulophaga sp. RHA_52]|uniref:CapA family protein n=1 Tax=Cellulophaga sp. RHA_52 TaxID=1250036 RepID=UPI00119B5ED4|nr:CapA family protein [Cellulophaga sp. RHA_52]TVZ08249.1 poly-gamma-glutamate synthesis protein (capsule biosynthesis protein) [Cellulophaga sp. RHA_52]
MKIIIAGDVFLGGDLIGEDLKSNINIREFHSSDIRILNLEHPITNTEDKADKALLYTDTSVIENLVKSNITAVNLANNHIHDKGNKGILDTLKELNKSGIGHFGGGANLEEAKKPYWVTKDLCFLGYCQFNSPTLNDIKLATKDSPGVNPLTLESILMDLDALPNNTKAILYFHWGREHVWLTQYKNINLTRTLLKHTKVKSIIGAHPHRIQGFIEEKNKKAYISLGNFLFPNFYFKKPIDIINYRVKAKVKITRQYHEVNRITYKKWRNVNRVSQLITYDTHSDKLDHILVKQMDDYPEVIKVKGVEKLYFELITNYISYLYKLPKCLYVFLERITSYIRFKVWFLQILMFKIRERGIKWLITKLKLKLYGK